jgi:hypothetical protein
MIATCANARLVDLHFSLRIAPAEERALRSHLVDCEGCRERYRRQLLLARLDPRAPAPADRLARGLGLRPGSRRRRFLLALATSGSVAMAALALWPRADAGFTPRGAPGHVPSVIVYRVVAKGPAQPVAGTIAASDELAFAYRNPRGHKYMMVFGVDEHRHVYWYHPAWTDPARDPAAVPIQPGTQLVELPEAISHSLDGSRLTIYALLLDDPVHVREVEDRLSRGTAPVAARSDEESLTLDVHP